MSNNQSAWRNEDLYSGEASRELDQQEGSGPWDGRSGDVPARLQDPMVGGVSYQGFMAIGWGIDTSVQSFQSGSLVQPDITQPTYATQGLLPPDVVGWAAPSAPQAPRTAWPQAEGSLVSCSRQTPSQYPSQAPGQALQTEVDQAGESIIRDLTGSPTSTKRAPEQLSSQEQLEQLEGQMRLSFKKDSDSLAGYTGIIEILSRNFNEYWRIMMDIRHEDIDTIAHTKDAVYRLGTVASVCRKGSDADGEDRLERDQVKEIRKVRDNLRGHFRDKSYWPKDHKTNVLYKLHNYAKSCIPDTEEGSRSSRPQRGARGKNKAPQSRN